MAHMLACVSIIYFRLYLSMYLADNGQASGDTNNRGASKESKKSETAAPSRPTPVYTRSPSVSADPIRSKCVEMLETSLNGDGSK